MRRTGPIRFVELRERARTVADIAQTLAQELGDPADSEVRSWAEAAQDVRGEPLSRCAGPDSVVAIGTSGNYRHGRAPSGGCA